MFVDRDRELAKIRSLLQGKRSLNLLYGKRQVGKTRLLQEAFRGIPHVYFLARPGSSSENLRELLEEFSRQELLAEIADPGEIRDWSVFLALLRGRMNGSSPLVLVLDEFQYLLEAVPQLPGLLQRFWDGLGEEAGIHIFVSGSSLGVLSRLGMADQPLYGRFSWEYKMTPFDYLDASLFVPKWSRRNRMRAYGVFGGLARRLELLNPQSSFDKQVVTHILDPLGGLRNSAYQTLQAESVRQPSVFYSVLTAIGRGQSRPARIMDFTGLTTGSLNNALKGLLALELIERQIPFGEKPNTTRSIYRLRDPFLMFNMRYVDRYRSLLEKGDVAEIYRRRIKPDLSTYFGHVFELICQQYLLRFGAGLLGEVPEGMCSFWNRDSSIEIDIMARLGRKGFLAGECKWRERRPVGMEVVGDLKRKLASTGRAEWAKNTRLMIASSSGFSQELASSKDVLLIGPDELFPPAESPSQRDHQATSL